MLRSDEARVPFAAAGVLMILMAALTSTILFKMKADSVSYSVEEERERGLNEAIAYARADIDRALSMSGIYAEDRIGQTPLINRSASCPLNGTPEEVNLQRLRLFAHDLFSRYLTANYADGNFLCGDYTVRAEATGDYRDVTVEPLNVTVQRSLDSPVQPCGSKYEAYYVISASVLISVEGAGVRYSEAYRARALAPSRYPLLMRLCEEYEDRMAGMPMTLDVTGAALAYTLARGYCQYATTEPMNIVDNRHLEVIVNGASLLEQGFVFNSVDPLSLAWLTVKAGASVSGTATQSVNNDTYTGMNGYDAKANANRTASPAPPPQEYGFNADAIVDSALVDMFRDDGIKRIADGAYTCEMHLETSTVTTGETYTGKELLSSLRYPYTTYPVLAREKWAWQNRLVTIEYVMDRYSCYCECNDVVSPFDESVYMGRYDPNLLKAVDSYKAAIRFDTAVDGVLSGQQGERCLSASFVSERGNAVEPMAQDMLYVLADSVKRDIRVTVGADDYRSPQETVGESCSRLQALFEERYAGYMAEGDYRESNGFRSCGAKALFYIRKQFLDDIGGKLNASAGSAPDIEVSIDSSLSRYSPGLDSSTLMSNIDATKGLLDGQLYVPFGLTMGMNSSPEASNGYPWEEKVAFAVDQRPDYLTVAPYTDKATGYSLYPLKVRNICLFSVPSGFASLRDMSPVVLDGLGNVYDASSRLPDGSVRDESSSLMGDIAGQSRDNMKREIAGSLVNDTEMMEAFSQADIDAAVDKAFEGKNDREVIDGLSDGSIKRDIGDRLAVQAETHAWGLNGSSDYSAYIGNKTRLLSGDASDKSVASTLSGMNGSVEACFGKFVNSSAGLESDPAISAALKSIPLGLPLLPPYGYWATLNVWYIEADGELVDLVLYDADCEPVPDPVFGHRATLYRRQRDIIDDGMGVLGSNEPVRFNVKTATFIVVPAGGAGVGDRTGGWDEKSPGYGA